MKSNIALLHMHLAILKEGLFSWGQLHKNIVKVKQSHHYQ